MSPQGDGSLRLRIMVAFYELHFQPGDMVKEVMTPYGEYYVLPDGRRIERHHRYVWCFGCNGLSWAEKLSPIEEIDAMIQAFKEAKPAERPATRTELRSPDPDVSSATGASWQVKYALQRCKWPEERLWVVDSYLRLAFGERDLLRARAEPCHCTRCGGTEFVEVLFHTEFTLPDGSGTVIMNFRAVGSASRKVEYYTPDGHPMPREEVPPAPPEPGYPRHFEWPDAIFALAVLATCPIWGPIVLLVRARNRISRDWNSRRRSRGGKEPGQ